MHTFVPDCTCWSLLLTALAIRLRNKPTYNKLRVLIINKDVRKSLARKNGNENLIWSWNDSPKRLKVTDEASSQGDSQQVRQHILILLSEIIERLIRKFTDNFGALSKKLQTEK